MTESDHIHDKRCVACSQRANEEFEKSKLDEYGVCGYCRKAGISIGYEKKQVGIRPVIVEDGRVK